MYIDVALVLRGLVVAVSIVAVTYVFVKTLQHTGSFTKAILAVSIAIDFILIVLWVLGIDRPLFQLSLQRIGASVTITALSMFIPLKLLFTIYLFAKQRQLQQAIG